MSHDIAFRFDGCGTTHAGRRDGLAIVGVGYIAGGEKSGSLGCHEPGSPHDVSEKIKGEKIGDSGPRV